LKIRLQQPSNNFLTNRSTQKTFEYDEFVKCVDFFDVKKGWMKFWDPQLTFNQIFVRERDGGLSCFDAFRAFAFLWISK
jgi:hypothetical protein